jgi:hypothetical protein
MAYSAGLVIIGTKTAGADYSSSSDQYTLVKTTAAGTVTQQVTEGGVVFGILQNRPASGSAAAVAVSGISKCRMKAASVAVFDKLQASTAATAMAAAAKSDYTFGRALEASTVACVMPVLITHQGGGSTEAAAGA